MDVSALPIEAFQRALIQIDRVRAGEIFESTRMEKRGSEALELLTMKSLENIGNGWENGEISLSQVYMSGVICEDLIAKYMDRLPADIKKTPVIGIGVLLDHHALGKRIVSSVLSAGGYNVIDLGQGLSAEEMVEKTIEKKIDFLLISTLMLSSALKVETVASKLREQQAAVKIIVGGAPFRLDRNLWKKVASDADGRNGTEAATIIDALAEGGL